jgi:tetratricopeptide (TPR) repeat protein
MKRRIASSVLFTILLAAAGAAGADDQDKPSLGLGKVKFQNSCSPAVQKQLQDAVAMLHSFFYSAAVKAFEDVGRQDGRCAIAAWGYASILMNNPLAGLGASAKDAPLAQAAIDKGRAMNARTQRERDYLEAVAAYYDNFANRTERERQISRAGAYEKLAAAYPKDDEAQIFYALYLAGTQLQSDQTYANYLKAAAILEKQFKKHPGHPGVAHYLIHSYDAPPIAKDGVPAARRYAQIAPEAPHALHMPSHIFTRVGAWGDSAATNRRSATAAQKSGEFDEATHALDYMTYANLQLARDGEARKAIDEAQAIKTFNPARFTAPYALAAMPARYAVERADWRAAAQLEPRQDKYPFTVALTHFARALGAARSGDGASAQKDAERIAALGEELKAAKNAYWGNEVEVMRLAAAAWTELAQGKGDEALQGMRQAADLEDKSEKHIVTPARLLPARELLGDMLMELKRPAEALKEYEASQKREPKRLRGLYGAGLAASQAGERAKAKQYFGRLVAMAGKGDPRPELAAARAWLAGS